MMVVAPAMAGQNPATLLERAKTHHGDQKEEHVAHQSDGRQTSAEKRDRQTKEQEDDGGLQVHHVDEGKVTLGDVRTGNCEGPFIPTEVFPQQPAKLSSRYEKGES